MIKQLDIKGIIGLLCIGCALLLLYNKQNAVSSHDLSVLELKEPQSSLIEIVKPISRMILDKDDRAKLAIFNQEFAKKIISYDTDLQKLNDVYALAGSYFFEGSLKDKYDGLDAAIISLIQRVTTDENHTLTQSEKQQLSDNFLALSWLLTQE